MVINKIKLLLKSIFYFLLFIFLLGIYQSAEYDSAYINKNSFQIDFNKIRTPALKKIFLVTEFEINNFFF